VFIQTSEQALTEIIGMMMAHQTGHVSKSFIENEAYFCICSLFSYLLEEINIARLQAFLAQSVAVNQQIITNTSSWSSFNLDKIGNLTSFGLFCG